MGTNRRYARHFDRLMDERILERVAAEGPLQSLTADERQDSALPVTRDPQPKRCVAWVRFGPTAILVEATVVVWNDIACGIEFTAGERVLRCWVWANAVMPVENS